MISGSKIDMRNDKDRVIEAVEWSWGSQVADKKTFVVVPQFPSGSYVPLEIYLSFLNRNILRIY